MEKIRISQIAKEIGKPSKEILQKAQELGFEAKTASSAVTTEQAEELYNYVLSGKSIETKAVKTEAKATKEETKTKKTTRESSTKKTTTKATAKTTTKTAKETSTSKEKKTKEVTPKENIAIKSNNKVE